MSLSPTGEVFEVEPAPGIWFPFDSLDSIDLFSKFGSFSKLSDFFELDEIQNPEGKIGSKLEETKLEIGMVDLLEGHEPEPEEPEEAKAKEECAGSDPVGLARLPSPGDQSQRPAVYKRRGRLKEKASMISALALEARTGP
mmetsp:Transcript_21103/g.39666  ORF Transcript_21103/g.39666 Transcript_21103/m.39666 type:complete len:141 (-) Transcript_21103:106-528(-)